MAIGTISLPVRSQTLDSLPALCRWLRSGPATPCLGRAPAPVTVVPSVVEMAMDRGYVVGRLGKRELAVWHPEGQYHCTALGHAMARWGEAALVDGGRPGPLTRWPVN